MSARPWPDERMPTPEEFADWYPTASREERVRVAAAMLEAGERANHCLVTNHDGAIRELEVLRSQRAALRRQQ